MNQPSWEEMEKAIRELPSSKKIDLVDMILDSIEAKDISLTPAVRSVLEKRLESYEKDKLEAKPWPEIRSRWITDAKQ